MDRIYEDEDNNHGLDNSLPMVHTPPALLRGNNSIMVHTPPANVNIEGPSNNYLNSPNNGNENDLRSESGLTSHLSLGIVSSVTRSSPSNNICPSSSRISAGYSKTIPLPTSVEFDLFQSFGIDINEENDDIVDIDM